VYVLRGGAQGEVARAKRKCGDHKVFLFVFGVLCGDSLLRRLRVGLEGRPPLLYRAGQHRWDAVLLRPAALHPRDAGLDFILIRVQTFILRFQMM